MTGCRVVCALLRSDIATIANYRRKPMVLDEEIQNLAILLTFDDEIADRNNAIVCPHFDQLEQILQLVKTAVYITNYDCAAHLSFLIKQMVYRVGGTVGQVGCDDISLRVAQLTVW